MRKKVFKGANIMLPREGISMEKWAVVACDQFTSEPAYWEEVQRETAGTPSSYELILPEVYLEAENLEERLHKIRRSMETYMAEGLLQTYENAMIYVERTDSTGKCRQGLVGCVDLEEYDYRKGSASMIRATEQTVVERIPPRLKVREQAPLEIPHIMILIDDIKRTVVEPLADHKEAMKKLYDFDLMLGGGHIAGYLLGEEEQKAVYEALENLGSREAFEKRYGLTDVPVLLYAMGDGNHSLATAKAYYEKLKAEHPGEDYSGHPARYALTELVNLHSSALEFEAIHRILTEISPEDLLTEMTASLGLIPVGAGFAEDEISSKGTEPGGQRFKVVMQGKAREYLITKPVSKLTVGSVQSFLDGYLAEKGGKIDYIHGLDVLYNLSMSEKSLGIALPDMGKEELFPTVIADGALPRKTFSMGHAQDKRYYIEARMIR